MSEPSVAVDKRIVIDGKIRHLAVTKIQQFNPDEEGCPQKWWFGAVQGRKEPEKSWHVEGGAVDEQVTHYLATGDDVLGRVARPGLSFLPAPSRELLLQWGLNDAPRPVDPVTGKPKNYFPPEQSLVRAAGIPLIGFTDIINGREEYLVPIDEYGEHVELRAEPGVVEVADVKTTKNFRWTKKHDELRSNTQMLGYAKLVAEMVPSATHVRLSHNAFLTEGTPKAIKRSVLVPVSEVHARWGAIELVAEQMKVVAATQRAEDVPGNLSACESFGGCPHKPYCHHHRSQNPLKRFTMGLLKNRTTPAPNGAPPPAVNGGNTPWIPPTPPPQSFAPPPQQVPVAPAQTMQPPVPQALPPVPAPQPQAAPSGRWIKAVEATQGQKYIIPPMNALTVYLSSTNGKQSFIPLQNGQPNGTPILIDYQYDVFELLPFEQPAPQPAPTQAAPPPPLPPAPLAPQVAREPSAPPPPPPLAAQSQIQPPSQAPVPPPPPPGAPAKRGRKLKVQDHSTPDTSSSTGNTPTAFRLFVNAIPNGPHVDLSGYVAEAAQALQEQFGVIDIRIAPSESPLAFAKWRGFLAQVAKQDPPPPGTYVAFTRGNELTEVVVEALAPLCAPGQLVRGI